MNAIQEIESQVLSIGYNCLVEKDNDGRIALRIDGNCYSPRDAAERFILGGWNAIWQGHES